jgi:RNA polymerase sigma-70 factor (ECF subfamily)
MGIQGFSWVCRFHFRSRFPEPRGFVLSKKSASVNITNEDRLIRAAQQGQLEAFHQLVQSFDRPLLHVALRITGAEPAARAIYCEAMLKLYGSLGGVESECSLHRCAYRILASLCLEYLQTERASTLRISLSPRERIVFELRHYQGLDLRTVGEVLDTTEEVARNVLLRAQQKLYEAQAEK